MSSAHLRLGFVSARSLYEASDTTEGRFFTDAATARLLEALRSKFDHLTLAMSRNPEREPAHRYPVPLLSQDVLTMPYLPSTARGLPKALPCRRVLREVEARSHVLIVQLPFASPIALLGARRPRVYHLVHDVRAVARTSGWYSGPKRIAALAAAAGVDHFQRALIHGRRARLVANGRPLFEHYGTPPGCAVVSSTIHESEIMSVSRQRPANAPFRVLSVGYLRPEKGIDTLVQAFERLLDDLPMAELDIVGAQAPLERGVTDPLTRSVLDLGRKGTVRFLGHKAFGPELFQCFADADVLALPSLAEGTPRVLVEARAFGCPVVATTVGGNPTSVEHEVDGLLIPPRDPGALKTALLRLARDPALKTRLIAGGVERARRSTVEMFAHTLAEEAILAHATASGG
jgi:glycosyltransferase involved in cell wall biosynthesis